MIQVGKKNQLRITRQVDFGFYLDGEELGEILIPQSLAPKDSAIGDLLDAFVYRDSEDRLIATTENPLAEVDTCGFLKVVATSQFGAFLNWGLAKDLLVPFKEQRVPMEVGRYYAVFVYLDITGRIAASSKLSTFLAEENERYFEAGQKVELLIAMRSDVGYKAVIENTHLGIIHHSDVFQPIRVGDRLTGFINTIRSDDRINLVLQPANENVRESLPAKIISYIKSQGGSITLTDKSHPDEIYKIFHVSKANYKKALGTLYKEKHIWLGKDIIRLI
jgi:predicted RNA-binding protein (virulence factor B family)